jgi:uncharacterized protein YraI
MMRQASKRFAIGFGLMLGTALPALAAPGFATGNVNLRAGPGTGYPEVVVVPNSAPVEIFGCLQGLSWCDVGFDGVRGWVSSSYLQYSYQGRRVPFSRYYGQTGVPVVGFQFGNYWGEHYRDRPWFTDRDHWGGPGRGGPGYGPAGGRVGIEAQTGVRTEGLGSTADPADRTVDRGSIRDPMDLIAVRGTSADSDEVYIPEVSSAAAARNDLIAECGIAWS